MNHFYCKRGYSSSSIDLLKSNKCSTTKHIVRNLRDPNNTIYFLRNDDKNAIFRGRKTIKQQTSLVTSYEGLFPNAFLNVLKQQQSSFITNQLVVKYLVEWTFIVRITLEASINSLRIGFLKTQLFISCPSCKFTRLRELIYYQSSWCAITRKEGNWCWYCEIKTVIYGIHSQVLYSKWEKSL